MKHCVLWLSGILCCLFVLQSLVSSEFISLTTFPHKDSNSYTPKYFDDNETPASLSNNSDVSFAAEKARNQEGKRGLKKRLIKEDSGSEKHRLSTKPCGASSDLTRPLLNKSRPEKSTIDAAGPDISDTPDSPHTPLDAAILRLFSEGLHKNPNLHYDPPGPPLLDAPKLMPNDMSMLYFLNNLSLIQNFFNQNQGSMPAKGLPYNLVPFLVKRNDVPFASNLSQNLNPPFSELDSSSAVQHPWHNETIFTKPLLDMMKAILEGQKNLTSVISQLGNSSITQLEDLRYSKLSPAAMSPQLPPSPQISPIMLAPTSVLQALASQLTSYKPSILKPVLLEQPSMQDFELQSGSKPMTFRDIFSSRQAYSQPIYQIQPRSAPKMYQPTAQNVFQQDPYFNPTNGRPDAGLYPQLGWGPLI